jgi:hypothetical protein
MGQHVTANSLMHIDTENQARVLKVLQKCRSFGEYIWKVVRSIYDEAFTFVFDLILPTALQPWDLVSL